MIGPSIAVIGGDERSELLAERLTWEGFDVGVFGVNPGKVTPLTLETALTREVLILPVPVTRDGVTLHAPHCGDKIPLTAVFGHLRPGTWLLGGAVGEDLRRQAAAERCRLTDYFDTDAVARQNAVPTAEGALAIAMDDSRITVSGSRCLVIGSGRCGKVLARLLKAVGADVTLTSRKARHALWARWNGLRPARTDRLAALIHDCDFIFNTVPVRVADAAVLDRMRDDALMIELASGAAGVDLDAAERLGKRVRYAPGLPGKVAPVTAAAILYRSVIGLLTEEYGWIDCE